MRVKLVLGSLGLIALVAGILAYRSMVPSPQNEPKILHNFSLPDVNGIQHSLEEWEGKVLVINFWATWCSPCREEITEFNKLQEVLGNQGLQFLGIAVEEPEPVKEFMQDFPINYPILVAGPHGIGLSVNLGNNNKIVPFSLVIDRKSRIVHLHSGIFKPDQIIQWVTPLL